MNLKHANWALEETARREGVSYDTVVNSIEEAVSDAIERCIQQGDETTLARIRQIPCAGNTPTALEIVAYMCDRVCELQ